MGNFARIVLFKLVCGRADEKKPHSLIFSSITFPLFEIKIKALNVMKNKRDFFLYLNYHFLDCAANYFCQTYSHTWNGREREKEH